MTECSRGESVAKESAPARRAQSLAAVVAAVFFLSLASCGIDIVSFMENKPVVQADLIFRAPATKDSGYLGLSLFYRIYATKEDAEADRAKLDARQASAAIPGDVVKSLLLNEASSGLKYRQIERFTLPDGGSFGSAPTFKSGLIGDYRILIQGEPDQGLIVLIDVNADGYYNAGDSLLVASRRIASESLFSLKPVDGDADYQKGSGTDFDANQFYIQIFAACYGIDMVNGTFKEMYSDAVHLGVVTFNFL